MGWRWRRSINIGGGVRSSLTTQGLGVSWGFAGFRIGRAPTGSLWISITIPGTGIGFFKYLSPKTQSTGFPQQPTIPTQTQTPIPHAPISTLTHNQRVLDEIRNSKP